METKAGLARGDVAGVYDGKARIYDTWAWLTETRARRRALELAAIYDGESVLEVAVGTGLAFADMLAANPHGRCEGVDVSPGMLAQARAKAEASGHANWQLHIGDAYALDFPDESFDLVVNAYMLDLLPTADFPHVLGEFHRVLVPGGRLVLVNMAPASHAAYRLWMWLYLRDPGFVGGCRGVEAADVVTRSGFTIRDRERLRQLGFPSEIVLAVK